MTWVRIDEAMTEHPKIVQLSDVAFRVHITALCYSNRNLTDGFVPTLVGHQRGKRYATELVNAGVWEAVKGGYIVHDFHDYQPSKDEVLALRQKRSAAGRAGADKRWGNREAPAIASAIASAKQNAWQTDAPVPSPQSGPLSIVSPSPQGRSGLTIEIKDKTISPGVAASIERLAERLTDADQGTLGRLVKFAKAGASQADFEDARAAITEITTTSPSRYACSVIQKRLAARREVTA